VKLIKLITGRKIHGKHSEKIQQAVCLFPFVYLGFPFLALYAVFQSPWLLVDAVITHQIYSQDLYRMCGEKEGRSMSAAVSLAT
jgi:hypothetical protein